MTPKRATVEDEGPDMAEAIKCHTRRRIPNGGLAVQRTARTEEPVWQRLIWQGSFGHWVAPSAAHSVSRLPAFSACSGLGRRRPPVGTTPPSRTMRPHGRAVAAAHPANGHHQAKAMRARFQQLARGATASQNARQHQGREGARPQTAGCSTRRVHGPPSAEKQLTRNTHTQCGSMAWHRSISRPLQARRTPSERRLWLGRRRNLSAESACAPCAQSPPNRREQWRSALDAPLATGPAWWRRIGGTHQHRRQRHAAHARKGRQARTTCATTRPKLQRGPWRARTGREPPAIATDCRPW